MMTLLMLAATQIDLNRAELAEIFTLPVDSAICRAIHEHRELYGPFQSVYELCSVPGVDAAVFEIIKPLVKIAVPFPPRTEWASILAEQRKLASEEPPAKAAIDEWEDLLFEPMDINRATFDDLLMIDRMTPIDAQAVIRHLRDRRVESARDLNRITGLSHYANVSLRRYVQYDSRRDKPVHGAVRIKGSRDNRLDLGEDDNLADRVASLEQAVDAFDETAGNLRTYAGWTDDEVKLLQERLTDALDTLSLERAAPLASARLRLNYQQRLRLGLQYATARQEYQGYLGLARVGPLDRFYLGNYRVIWGEGLLVDNSDEFRARTFSRSCGIYGDLTENTFSRFTGAAGSFRLAHRPAGVSLKPSFFVSSTPRDAIINPDNTVWRVIQGTPRYPWRKGALQEQTYGFNVRLSPLERVNPGSYIALETMTLEYLRDGRPAEVAPLARWVDIPLDRYDPLSYPEIATLQPLGKRTFAGAEFQVPIKNTYLSGEVVRQMTGTTAYAYVVKSRIQYEFLYLNALWRHYDYAFDNPYMRGFSEYRRFEDTPFERPYALVDPEYTALYNDPVSKPEEGLFVETRYQLTRNLIITRAYLDLYHYTGFPQLNQRAYAEIEYQPVFAVRIRYGQKIMTKYLPRPIEASRSLTSESSMKIFLFLSGYDALRVEWRYGNVGLTAVEGEDRMLDGGFLAVSAEHNFPANLSVEGGIAVWTTDGMSQWLFEDVGIDFLDGRGVKYYIVANQRVGPLLLRVKMRQKQSDILHYGLYNNEDLHYPDAPGIPVTDYTNHENATRVEFQLDYRF